MIRDVFFEFQNEYQRVNSSRLPTHFLQPIDRHLGKQIKGYIRNKFKEKLLEQHAILERNPKANIKITTMELRQLTTKWLGEAWEKCLEDPEFMVGTFERTGLSLPLDGSEDAEMIRFDGVDTVSVDSDSEPDENEESDEASDLDLVMPDNDESDYTDEDE